ncbi:DUF1513 domain-containing protein [Chitinimonas arctica]|uniref:DUF1513 domain-containing protein n=1 Tax=Chitinimonas arctica TaxID=2594795 RepID=A0A516SH10_9NEIS|nr:DUF1513 domain-containing protein [Chitinimonas arctica]QDQ27443.1 DUF1513 domain-containing protein [Chitinimonas arctica]
MPLSRRRLLAAGLGLTVLPLAARAGSGAETVLLSAGWTGSEDWRAGTTGRASIALPERGHVLLPDPLRPGEAIVVARRPGYFLARIDWRAGKLLKLFRLEDERNLVGHAIFSQDGRRLISAETDERSGEGRLAIRDAVSFKRLEDRPSHGVGPHELLWLDRHTLAVANGGILTLPETGRYKRNLDRMEPSLALIDARDGGLLASHRLADQRLSIRHLALAGDGALGIALQNQGNAAASLLAILRDGEFRLADCPAELAGAMRGYAASLAALGQRFLMPCPHGDLLTEWDSQGRPLAQRSLPKAVGAAALAGDWWCSGEGGGLWRLAPDGLALRESRQVAGISWDNHLSVAHLPA